MFGKIKAGYEEWYRNSPAFNGWFNDELRDGNQVLLLSKHRVKNFEGEVEEAYLVNTFSGKAGIPARFIDLAAIKGSSE